MSAPLVSLVAPAELRASLAAAPRPRILDVRTPGEFESVHMAGAYNVPLATLGEHAREIREQVTSEVVLVCQSGNRARSAEDLLKKHGMTNVHILEGGMNAWLAAGYDVLRGPARMSLERQVRILAGALAAVGGALASFTHPMFGLVPLIIGSGLVFAGATDRCGMALLLAKLPHNRPATCDISASVRALAEGR